MMLDELTVRFPAARGEKALPSGRDSARAPRLCVSALGLATAVVLLAGCATNTEEPGPYHIPVDALQRPVDYNRVCVLENPAVKADILIDAIQDGINAAGATYVPLPAGAGPSVCSYTLTYDVTYEGRLIRSVSFYTFENGVPIYSARGTPNGSGGVTFDMVSQYVQLVIERSRQGRSRVLPATTPNGAQKTSSNGKATPQRAAKRAAQPSEQKVVAETLDIQSVKRATQPSTLPAATATTPSQTADAK